MLILTTFSYDKKTFPRVREGEKFVCYYVATQLFSNEQKARVPVLFKSHSFLESRAALFTQNTVSFLTRRFV